MLFALLVSSKLLEISFWISKQGVATPGVHARDNPSESHMEIFNFMSNNP